MTALPEEVRLFRENTLRNVRWYLIEESLPAPREYTRRDGCNL